MKIRFQKSFTKQYKKLPSTQRQLVKDTLEIYAENPFEVSLRNHPLKDKWHGYHSITADNDLRLHFKLLSDNTALFVAVGTHNQLYS